MKFREDKTLVVSSQDVQKIVEHVGINALMDSLIANLEASIMSYDSRVKIPIRSGFHYERPNSGLIEWMPLYNEGENVLLKVVGYHPKNSENYDLPTIISTISTYDAKSGHLSAVMDGVLATALRTGAASAVASKIMAHSESSTLGLIGCGTQAITQIHALSRTFDLNRILIYDCDRSVMKSLESRGTALNLDIEFVESSVEEVVGNSDILCTATSIEVGGGPLFENFPTKAFLHVNAIGSDFPGKVEIPPDFLDKAFICPDFTEQALLEGECQQVERARIVCDLVELVQQAETFDYVKEQRSVFDSTGWALEDSVVMELFLKYTAELGLGQEIEIETMSGDVKNPYHFLLYADPRFEGQSEPSQTEISELNRPIQ